MKPAGEDNPTIYSFDDITVEPANIRLVKEGQVRPLEPRAFDLLVYFIEHPGRVIKKEELFEQVWKRSFVTDSALTQEIRQIRQALGDDAGAPRYIETIPKHGYRFIAKAQVRSVTAGETGEEVSGQKYNSLAVLPFTNLNADPELDYFVEGFTDQLITDLGKIRALKVISRTSAMRYKAAQKSLPRIARELNVKAIVEGAVLRIGDRVRITAQLIDAATDRHIWAESYERNLYEILSLQNEVSRTVAEKIHVTVLPEEKSRLARPSLINSEAYEAVLKGNHILRKFIPGGTQKAIDYFQTAIDIDPGYVAAYVALADAYGYLAYLGVVPPDEIVPRLKAILEKATEIDDGESEVYLGLGKAKLYNDLDRLAALRCFQRALELNPNSTGARTYCALTLLTLERMDEAMAEIKLALSLDPLSLPIHDIFGFHYFVVGQYDQAIDIWRKSLDLDPGFMLSRWHLWRVYRLKGMFDEAMNEFNILPMMYNDDVVQAAQAGYRQTGYYQAMREAAGKLVEQSRIRYISPTHIAMLYAHAEENDQAMDWLERAFEMQDLKRVAVGIEPDWEHLRSYPRFKQMLDRFGLQ